METSQKITPFLWYNGNVDEAIELYTSVFKDTKVLFVKKMGDKVMTAKIQLEGQDFMMLDGGPHYSFTPAVSFFVDCKTQEEVNDLWDKLIADGGKPDRCGWLRDKFGVSWQIIPDTLGKFLNDPNPVKARNVMNAMMQMEKIDIQQLKDAYEKE
ncbi:VOC family protein [Emticicia sp. C21]|uniref:VOC family protein n=1 Tax=Emticicia sp. C21 TaxID=2302915 RepID=UPI000E351CE4|nr:VOC family protein [Emticicia sp. C21]RFS15680.1 VOC family protein [Emticicia sp. C21]